MRSFISVLMLSSLSVALVTAQQSATVAPKHYKVAASEAPDSSVTPDGRFRLGEVETEGGDVHLFARDLTTGESRPLTEGPGSLIGARMSPDGRLVAYIWGKALQTEDPQIELGVVGIDGSGREVLYGNRNGPLLNGARLNLILNPPLLLHGWSPDGKYVAMTVFQKDQSQLVSVSVANASVRVLRTQARESLSYLSYFDEIRYSPDARFVAIDLTRPGSSSRDILTIPVEGGPEVPLVQHRANDRLVDWTPDGRGVLFASDRSGRWDLWVLQVFDGKPRGSPQMVYPDIGPRPFFNSLGLTRDGSYYHGVTVWESDVYLATLDPATSGLRGPAKLVSHVGSRTSTQWSRDGQSLAYAWGNGDEDDPFVLGIRSAETGKERRLRLGELRRHGDHGFAPQWSPDGRSILVDVRTLDYLQGQSLYGIDVQTGAVTPVVLTDYARGYNRIESEAWSGDGNVIFEQRPPARIVTRHVETGEETELYRPTPPAEVHHWPTSNLSVSPDSQRLAFVWSDGKNEMTTALMVLATAGGAPRELVRARDPARIGVTAWTPDSRHILYARTVAGDKGMFEFWRIAADGGEPRNLGLKMEALRPYGLSVHPDGTRIAFTAGTERRREVWVLKDFLPGLARGSQSSLAHYESLAAPLTREYERTFDLPNNNGPEPSPETFRTAFGLLSHLYLTPALGALLQGRVPDHLDAGPLPASELARRSGLHTLTLTRALRALAAFGAFRKVSPGVFANNPVSDLFRDRPGGLRNAALFWGGEQVLNSATKLGHSVKTGESSFEHVYRESFWDRMRRLPEEHEMFPSPTTPR